MSLLFLLISPLVSACGNSDSCVRNSDCPNGLGCSKGKCAVVTPPPADASSDAAGDAVADTGADRDSSPDDGQVPGDGDAADAAIENDAGPETGVADAAEAADDVGDAGSDSSD